MASNYEKNKQEEKENDNKSLVPTHSATLHLLPGFVLLEPKTNLNEPPTNWLSSDPKCQQHLYNFMWQRSHPMLSSIGMANNFPNLTGDVDVISNAKNLKKLLKMPFSRSHISLMVHRTGKTLLIDEFDIHRHLLRQQEDDWKWLREFYFDYVKKEMQVKCAPKKNKTRDNLQSRNMLSKFLYRSVLEAQPCDEERDRQTGTLSLRQSDYTAVNRLMDSGNSNEGSEFHQREVLWSFEDLQMLIGTDLPIFRHGGNYPCVSLRLRDMNTPINVLTGLDYWLDNLMCNVPEVAMCFHMNGIVQKYELIKTDDIPHMPDCKFNPEIVTDIARNILSFLKSNATKEGHTYWLYKGTDEDVVKLYDLTSLSEDTDTQSNKNPFVVPLGMLLYKVARNLWQAKRRKARIKMLLETCLILLDEDKYSERCTSARYLLSDILAPDGVLNDDFSDVEDDDDDREDDVDSDSVDQTSWETRSDNKISTVDVQALCIKSNYHKYHNPQLPKLESQDLKERCTEAVQNIAMGLQCLDRDFTVQIQKQKNIVEEQLRCNKDEAIPLHYEPLNTSAPPHNEADHPLHDKENVQLAETETSPTWHRLYKVLLLRKAAVAFCTTAKKEIASSDVGSSLKNIQLALYCFAGFRILLPKKAMDNLDLLAVIMTIAGDAHLSFVQQNLKSSDVGSYLHDLTEEEMIIIDSVKRELDMFEYDWVCEVTDNIGGNLERTYRCYKEALELSRERNSPLVFGEGIVSLTKRYGNIKNELGVWYMNQAQHILQNYEREGAKDKMEELLNKSLSCLLEGINSFEQISDSLNSALLLSNKGKLMRLHAQIYTQTMLCSESPEFTPTERLYYNKALECYQQALTCLGRKDKHPDVWDSVCWELSTTYFNMAMLLQDYAPLTKQPKDEVEKEVIDLMSKSLKYCNTESTSAHQPVYMFRAATINHRLASLYHSSLREEQSEQRRRFLKQLAENHYRKASSQYQTLECYVELLRVTLEQVALHEFCLTLQTSAKGRIRTLSSAISCLVSCSATLNQLNMVTDDYEIQGKVEAEGESLTNIVESRLQFLLLQLMKYYKENRKSKGHVEDLQKVKDLYALSLKPVLTEQTSIVPKLKEKWKILINLLEKLKDFYQTVLLHEPG